MSDFAMKSGWILIKSIDTIERMFYNKACIKEREMILLWLKIITLQLLNK